MKAGWFIGLIMLYVILTPIFGMVEQSFLPQGQMGVISTLVNPSWQDFSILFSLDYLNAIKDMLTFGYACLTGTWIILRYILCAISAGIVLSMIINLVNGKAS